MYLAGGINGLSDAACKDWRAQAKELLGVETLDPMVRDYRGREDNCMNEIVEGDKMDILNCDCLLVNAERPSWGTAMEVHFASDHGIPVFAFCPSEHPSPWLQYHSTSVEHTLEDAVACLKRTMH